ncbi:peptidoglycan-binding protein [Streptomyces sp. H39-S7]|uniref:peptidoglycan-binding protein n=1 Tax=Streptomyces sp. H39-S7 TaxID=3004357 RepID=UPI0022AED5A2|nr:peptidoglycan-binding protein [Streptomyces sp. H39-S7]MCZ4122212.1 peptidoglycan-binding protein [Streptomyces sp. H39-S7]
MADAPAPLLARRRLWVIAVAVGALAVSGSAAGASLVIKSPGQAAAERAAPAPDLLTAPVERRVLKDSVILRGTVRAGQSVDVSPSVTPGEGTGTPVVTKLLVAPRAMVTDGKVLLEVSGRPVFALRGALPVYRDLKPGATGGDVAQLQRSLAELGHRSGDDPAGTFGPGTKAALTGFYASIGYDPLPAHTDGGAAVKAARDAVVAAERALQDAQDAQDEMAAANEPFLSPTAKPGGGGRATGNPSAGKPATGKAAKRAVQRAREDLGSARTDLAAVLTTDGPMLPAGEVVYLDGFPARVDAIPAHVGSKVSGSAVMTVSAGALVVRGTLQEYQKGLVRPGQRVQILSEVSGVTATATVVSVATTVDSGQAAGATSQDQQIQQGQQGQQGQSQDQQSQEQGGPSGQRGYPLVVRPDQPLDPQLAGQDVRLTVEAASTDGMALVVPVTAISAGADGRTVVTVVAKAGAQRRVEVRPGTTGDGFVEVVPVGSGALAEGDRVVTGVKGAPAKGASEGASSGS